MTNEIRWTRNHSEAKSVDVCMKTKDNHSFLRIFDVKTREWIEDTAAISTVTCSCTIHGYETTGFIDVVTKSGSLHHFDFDDFERFKAVRKFLETVVF